MSPRTLGAALLRPVPTLDASEPLATAVRKIVDAKMPALPVVDGRGRLAGIFGERELIGAIFPGYLRELSYAAFVTEAVESQLELRLECREETVAKHMNTEHIEVPANYSDAQLAETFLHHRVLIVPVVEADGSVAGVVTRWDFFKALAGRLERDA